MAQQRHIVTLDNGTEIFYSYNTVIGFRLAYTRPVFTDAKHSVTTGKHRRLFMADYDSPEVVPHEEFKQRAAKANLPILSKIDY